MKTKTRISLSASLWRVWLSHHRPMLLYLFWRLLSQRGVRAPARIALWPLAWHPSFAYHFLSHLSLVALWFFIYKSKTNESSWHSIVCLKKYVQETDYSMQILSCQKSTDGLENREWSRLQDQCHFLWDRSYAPNRKGWLEVHPRLDGLLPLTTCHWSPKPAYKAYNII